MYQNADISICPIIFGLILDLYSNFKASNLSKPFWKQTIEKITERKILKRVMWC